MNLNFSKSHYSTFLAKVLVICLIICGFSRIYSLNVPQYYKADFLSNMPMKDHRNFVTNAALRYMYGSNHKGWGIHQSRKTNILNIYGDTNVSIMGVNVEGLNPITTPVAYEFLNPVTGIIPGFHFTGEDGTISLNGKFVINELDLDIQQNLVSGFFLYLYMPIRWLKVDDIKIINHTSPSNPHAAEFQAFLDTGFNTALNEFGLKNATTPFNGHGLGDVIFYLGWQGYNNTSLGSIFKDINGAVQVGLILPTSSSKSHHEVVSLSTGYNGHWGLSVRAEGEVGLKKFISLALYGGIDILQYKRSSMHLRTDKQQDGLIFLSSAWIHEKLGATWQIGGYVKVDRLLEGFNIILGYSFSAQDKTVIKVHDNNFLRTFIDAEAAAQVVNATTRNSMIAGEPQFRSWNQQVFHFALTYDFGALLCGNYSPNLAFFFDYPVMGKLAWTTTMVGLSAGINAHWSF